MKTELALKRKFNKRILSIILFGALLSFSANLFAQKANFSGNWTFNEGKSQLGEGRFRSPASKLTIVQKDSTLNMERTVKRMDGEESTLNEKFTFDGKVCENTGFMNNVKKSTLAWSADNKTLTISSSSVFERDGNTMEIKSTEVITISDDGKTLTINTTNTSPRGERKQTLVYDKAI